MVTLALTAEEVGLDVFATGEHHNPPFVPSSPTTMLGLRRRAARSRIILSTATTLITTNDPVKIAEDYAMLQHLAGGRVDLMMGRGNTGPVYPWFGQDIRNGIPLAVEHYALLHRLWREDVVDWQGRFRTPLTGLHQRRPGRSTASRRSCGTARSAAPRSPSRPPTTATASSTTTSSGRPITCGAWSTCTGGGSSTTATAPADQAIVGLGGQVFMRADSQAAIREFRPYFDHAPVYGGGPSLEDYMAQTPLTVGSPQQVIDRTMGFREIVGDYQRQLFLVDHAGLPPTVALEQLEMLGTLVVPGAAPRVRGAASRRTCPRRRPTPASRPRATPRPPTPSAEPRRGRRARRRAPRPRSPSTSHDATRRLVVVSAGLSQPSSTRLLADRLAAATDGALATRGHRQPASRSSSCATTPATSSTTC